ncbi:NAD-P-binding protein [Mycena leptocephala]|nr:NAD-P-binding protein [Mycena leptocephala]
MIPGREMVLTNADQVTGVSGFVGSHVAAQLLAEGYVVRGTARGNSLVALKTATIGNNPNFEVVEVEDIATSDLSRVLQGVKYIIHTASPLAGRATPAEGLKSAVRGTLNVLEQAEKAGVSKIVVTSSWATTMDPSLDKMYNGVTLSHKDWGTVTEEELLAGNNNAVWNYLATKILAERAAWEFAESHPSVDLTTINPPFIYGPLHADFPTPDRTRLGANVFVYALIAGEPGRPLPPQLAPFYCDVRDVARAHVRSLRLTAKPSEHGVQKRFLICGGSFTWAAAVEHLAFARADLKDSLSSAENAPPLPGPLSTSDSVLAKEILGIEEYIPWEKSVCDALDCLLEAEKAWK